MPLADIDVEGLDDWRATLRNVDLKAAVKDANRAAGDLVVTEAEKRRSRLEGRFPAYDKVRIRASRTQKGAQVTVGPKGVGFAAEFGAYVHPVFGRLLAQSRFRRQVWPLWAGSGEDAGYLVFPTIREHGPRILETYETLVVGAVAKQAFPEGAPIG